ncbi:hypothetical protein F6U93_00660 [Tamlana haliotis]|uniref:SGNH/GDSL hydrolase family protein n=1 Tax=Pseudotamlana haliotis TaxID=2614804 RepID=A0A6N6MPV8_9FLAO|nr:hypothetical protein [Tamlana haliotis]KAB1071275.1 hypothetical protein F6U93_00660 [Tamlana haliotis]
MKKFIIKSFAFFTVVIGVVSFILMNYGGNVDYFYEKFTTKKAHSIILGDSRSFQGIQPSIVDSYFENFPLQLPILNYSFTLKQTAYGPPYLESVKRKLNSETKNGLFIISVHPFLLANRSGKEEEKQGEFFEADMPPHNMRFVNNSPNFEYLLKNFDYFHFRGIIKKSSKTHKDGWLEETNLPDDKALLKTWKDNQITLYNGFQKKWLKSEIRLEYLEKLILYLKNHGHVVLVRLPIDKELIAIENEFWNTFNIDMRNMSNKNDIEYITFSEVENTFNTYDGIHIDKFGGVPFTKALCDSINVKLEIQKH